MIDYAAVPRVFVMLLAFGLLYNALVVDKLERWLPRAHGVTAFEVVGGVLVTMLGFGMVAGFDYMLVALVCFAASGIPMIVGSLRRMWALGG